jgi:hypothetical protein
VIEPLLVDLFVREIEQRHNAHRKAMRPWHG